jgi:DhnA family fructose-bisphosphate aldolase class Ia
MGQKEDYLDRFFHGGKTVILPIDHGTAIPVSGLDRPGELIRATRDQVDGYVVNYGLARACEEELAGKGICFRTDVYKPPSKGNTDEGAYRIFAVEEALQVGAAAVMNMLYLHHPNESVIIRECADLIADCAAADLPVILEALPYGIGRPDDYTVENIGFTVRMAAELGADVVKTAYPTGASPDEFKAIIDGCFVPVIVLGGAAMGDDRALLTMVGNAMAAGASGIAVGRNVWQHANPPAIAGALKAMVHESATANEALAGMSLRPAG